MQFMEDFIRGFTFLVIALGVLFGFICVVGVLTLGVLDLIFHGLGSVKSYLGLAILIVLIVELVRMVGVSVKGGGW